MPDRDKIIQALATLEGKTVRDFSEPFHASMGPDVAFVRVQSLKDLERWSAAADLLIEAFEVS